VSDAIIVDRNSSAWASGRNSSIQGCGRAQSADAAQELLAFGQAVEKLGVGRILHGFDRGGAREECFGRREAPGECVADGFDS